MEHLTLKELASLNRLVKKAHAREALFVNQSGYFQKPIAECPAYIQKSMKRVAELSALQDKLERLMLEAEY